MGMKVRETYRKECEYGVPAAAIGEESAMGVLGTGSGRTCTAALQRLLLCSSSINPERALLARNAATGERTEECVCPCSDAFFSDKPISNAVSFACRAACVKGMGIPRESGEYSGKDQGTESMRS